MTRWLVVMIVLLLFVTTAQAADVFLPDAGLVAYKTSGGVTAAASWLLAEPEWLGDRGCWLDVFDLENIDDLEDVGIGASIDIQAPMCFGVGYQDGLFGYVGTHVTW